jgi:hypothetical protein
MTPEAQTALAPYGALLPSFCAAIPPGAQSLATGDAIRT